MKEKRFLRFWFPLFAYSAIIFYVSSLSRVSVPLKEMSFDKVVHVLEYLPFGFLLARALRNKNLSFSLSTLLLWVVLGSFLYGLTDEIHQSFVPGRTSSLWDVFADTVGGGLGAWIYIKRLKY